MTQATANTQEVSFDDVQEWSPVFPDGEYILRVVRIENADGGKFGPSLKWIWSMTSVATGEVVMAPDSSGEAYEWHVFSSKKMTPRSKPYPWVTALLNRPLEIGESGASLIQAVLGKSMQSYCAPPQEDPSGRQRILTAKPVGGTKTSPSPGIPPALEPAQDKPAAEMTESERAAFAARYRELFGDPA